MDKQLLEALSGIEHMQVMLREDIPERFHLKNNRRVMPLFAMADEGWTITDVSSMCAVHISIILICLVFSNNWNRGPIYLLPKTGIPWLSLYLSLRSIFIMITSDEKPAHCTLRLPGEINRDRGLETGTSDPHNLGVWVYFVTCSILYGLFSQVSISCQNFSFLTDFAVISYCSLSSVFFPPLSLLWLVLTCYNNIAVRVFSFCVW